MPNKEFLEEYPLYKKFKTSWEFILKYDRGPVQQSVPKPAIHMYCSECGSEQTFNMENEYFTTVSDQAKPILGTVKDIRYRCSACGKGLFVFLVSFGVEKISEVKARIVLEKVGQIPAWSIEIDRSLEKILNKNSQYYKNGLTCESQGYGIGAHAYYRRIVEDVIDTLLESIKDFISSKEELKIYQEALQKVANTTIARDKIEVVKDVLPSALRPGGINPLQVLYDELSEGIHLRTDEECLESADAIRNSLVYLAKQVIYRQSLQRSSPQSAQP